MIAPTVGRVVWFYPRGAAPQPNAAIIAFVHNDRLVNLAYFDVNGVQYSAQRVQLLQDGEQPTTRYCTWMPFQIGQAKIIAAAAPNPVFASGDSFERDLN